MEATNHKSIIDTYTQKQRNETKRKRAKAEGKQAEGRRQSRGRRLVNGSSARQRHPNPRPHGRSPQAGRVVNRGQWQAHTQPHSQDTPALRAQTGCLEGSRNRASSGSRQRPCSARREACSELWGKRLLNWGFYARPNYH